MSQGLQHDAGGAADVAVSQWYVLLLIDQSTLNSVNYLIEHLQPSLNYFLIPGIGLSLFLVFGEPLRSYTQNTDSPNWENIGIG